MVRNLLLGVVFVLVCVARAHAAPCNPAHTFVTGEVLTAAVLNANPNNEQNCFNNIDNTNIGVAGIYASQLLPTSLAQATFGGAFGYTFSNGLTVNGSILTSAVGFTSGNGIYQAVTGQAVNLCPNGSCANAMTVFSNGTAVAHGPYQGTHNACSSSSGLPCAIQTTCSTSSNATCSVTASVPSGALCAVSEDSSGFSIAPVSMVIAGVSGTTLTDQIKAASSGTNTYVMDNVCD